MSAALLAAIAAELENDAPRLVYADALSERQDARGEFSVLQCRAPRLPPSNPLRDEMIRRASTLLDVHRGLVSRRPELGLAIRARLPALRAVLPAAEIST